MKDDGLLSRFPIVILLSVIVAAFASLRSSHTVQPKHQLSVIVSESALPRWVSFQAGLMRSAEDSGISLNYVSTNELRTLEEVEALAEKELSEGADAIVLQLPESEGAAGMVERLSRRTVLVLVDTVPTAVSQPGAVWESVTADDYAIGETLGRELIAAAAENGTVGILCDNTRQSSLQRRVKGMKNVLAGSSLELVWEQESGQDGGAQFRAADELQQADAIAAVDDKSLALAVSYAAEREEKPLLLGVGNSDQNVYALDQGAVQRLIVVNEFNMGYQAVLEAAAHLEKRGDPAGEESVEFRVISHENMFESENQKLLFPLVQ